MPANNKQPVFGTLSTVALFFGMFLITFALLIWIMLTFGLKLSGSESSDFGAGLFIAYAIVPTLIVSAIFAWFVASIIGKKFQDKVIPENKTSGMVLWGLGMLIPSWIIGLLVWNTQTGSPKPQILVPAITAVLLQVAALAALGLVGKSNDVTRRKVWGILLCIVVIIIPSGVLKIAAR
jgi:hypothetical protein